MKNVINRIRLKPSINPQEIKSRISKEFERNAPIDASKITVKAAGSKITLRGTVRSWAEQIEASKAAWSIPEVTEVENLISVSYEYTL